MNSYQVRLYGQKYIMVVTTDWNRAAKLAFDHFNEPGANGISIVEEITLVSGSDSDLRLIIDISQEP